MTRPAGAGSEVPAATYVRDGFHVFAFVLPWLWLLVHRLWIEAALAFAVAIALVAFGSVVGPGFAGPLLSLAVAIYIGLEAPALRIEALRRRGWSEWGVVEAENLDEAETQFLSAWEDERPAGKDVFVPTQPVSTFRPAASPGLLLNPGNR